MILLINSLTLARQLRRWHPFLAVIGDTRWPHNGEIITGADPETPAEEVDWDAIRLGWETILSSYSNTQIKELGYNAFISWIRPSLDEAIAKVKEVMQNPNATLPQIKAWVEDRFSLLDLSNKAEAWQNFRATQGMYLGIPAIGTTSVFGTSQTCVAWSHQFSNENINWLKAMLNSQGQESNYLVLDELTLDWSKQ